MATWTGNGAAITFSGVTVAITAIRFREMTLGSNDISTLATANGFVEKGAHDLVDAGGVDIEYLFDSLDASELVIPAGASTSLTVTWPSQGGTAAKVVGTAYISGSKGPDLVNNEHQVASVSFTWDGLTIPAFTDEV